MISKYRRYEELKDNAKKKLLGKGILEELLTNAVIEISFMRKEDVPEHLWESVKDILDTCTKYEALKDEGRIRASINMMNHKELQALKNAITYL